jgi:hypothetical protein
VHTTNLRTLTLRAAVLAALPLSLSACEPEGFEQDDGFADEQDVESRAFPQSTVICPNVINDGIGLMRYCRNRNIYTDNNSVERAIIVIHGSGLDAQNYYNTTVAEAVAEGVDLSKTDIIAPQFFQGLPTGTWTDYYEWSGGWRYGHDAVSHARSSYEVIDHIVGQLMDHRPNLKTIVVAGQSAGGQFVDRYSVGTRVAHPGVNMRFWAANPGSQLWFTSARPGPTCAGYNDYPYGLNARNEYMNQSTVAELKQNATSRDIFWTAGELDTDQDGWNCKDLAQGTDRNDRWDNHRSHIADVCNALGYAGLYCLVHSARHVEIPGCGHGHVCSWQSDEGHEILFGQ